jgi:hypothetical protein
VSGKRTIGTISEHIVNRRIWYDLILSLSPRSIRPERGLCNGSAQSPRNGGMKWRVTTLVSGIVRKNCQKYLIYNKLRRFLVVLT